MAVTIKHGPHGERCINLEEVKDVIMPLFERGKHVLVGPVALLLKCSLSEAEKVMEELRYAGHIRLLSKREAQEIGVLHGYIKVKPSV